MKAEGLNNKEIRTAPKKEKKENNKEKFDKSDKKSSVSKKDITNKKIDDFFKNKLINNVERDTNSPSKVEERKVKSTNGKHKSNFPIITINYIILTYFYHLLIF